MEFKQFNKKIIAGAAAALAVCAGTLAGVGTADAETGSIVGAWEIAVVPGPAEAPLVDFAFMNALVVSSDGTLVNTGPGARAGVGVWGGQNGEYTLHVVHPIDTVTQVVRNDKDGRTNADDKYAPLYGNGNLVYDIVVTVTLSDDGDQAVGQYETKIRSTDVESGDGFDVQYTDTGTVFAGTVHYDRIGIERN